MCNSVLCIQVEKATEISFFSSKERQGRREVCKNVWLSKWNVLIGFVFNYSLHRECGRVVTNCVGFKVGEIIS